MKSTIKKYKINNLNDFDLIFDELKTKTIKHNLIIDFNLIDITRLLPKILKLNDSCIQNNKSLVIVSPQNSHKIINIVPTDIEAEDIIQIEEIERDLKV